MTGLIIFGVVAVYVAFWFYVLKAARTRTQRAVAVLVAVLIPFWDLPIGYFQFQRHCSTEGGIHVYERIAPQDKLYFESDPSSPINDMLKQGFKIVELARSDGKGITRYEVQQGKVVSRTVQTPESLIAVSITRNEVLTWNIYRYDHIARSMSSSKVVVRHTGFTWHGGWLKESLGSLFRGRLSCSSPLSDLLIPLLQRGS